VRFITGRTAIAIADLDINRPNNNCRRYVVRVPRSDATGHCDPRSKRAWHNTCITLIMNDQPAMNQLQEALMRSVQRTRRRLWITCMVAITAWMMLAAFV
jgi:hypothetical protein